MLKFYLVWAYDLLGATVANRLANHFGTIANLMKASQEELITVDDIGHRIAQSLVQFFENPKNIKLVERLKVYGVTMEDEIKALSSEILVGKKHCCQWSLRNPIKKRP